MFNLGLLIGVIIGSFIGIILLVITKDFINKKKSCRASSELHKQHTLIDKWDESPTSSISH